MAEETFEGRSVPEWIGKTPDAMPPPRVRARIFMRHDGFCYLTGRKITPADKWQLDHIVAIINGGENRESNLAPVLFEAHKAKTKSDLKIKAKTARIRKKHLGIKKPSSFSTSRDKKWKKKVDGTVVRRDQD